MNDRRPNLRPIRHGQGLWQVVRFNAPRYLIAMVVAIGGFASGHVLGILVACIAAWFIVASLIASYWVYDASDLYSWSWIAELLPQAPKKWLSVTAGFDQHSAALEKLFPGGEHRIVDLFAADLTTEESVRRARRRASTCGRRVSKPAVADPRLCRHEAVSTMRRS